MWLFSGAPEDPEDETVMESLAPMHCFLLWIAWRTASALKTKMLNMMQYTGWYRLQYPGRPGGGPNQNDQMGNHWFGFWWRMHTLMILNGLRMSKQNERLLSRVTLHRVLQKHGGYIDGSCHASHWYWETPRTRITVLDNGMTNGHAIPGWIFRLADGLDRHFCQCLSSNLQSIPNLIKTKHQMRHICTSLMVIKVPCLLHLHFTRQWYFVLCQPKFVI